MTDVRAKQRQLIRDSLDEIKRLRGLLKEVGDLAASRANRVTVLESENENLQAALQRPYITSELAWENRLEGIAQSIEDEIGNCPKSQVEAYLKAADIVRKAKEATND